MKALIFEEFGGPEVLQYQEVPCPTIKEDEILIQMKAIGLNFADVYRRKGNYHLEGEPPFILGYEGAGIVEAVGDKVSAVKVGQRIAFADVPYANAEYVAVPVAKAIPIPTGITFETAAAVLLQGLTAHYLAKDSYKIKQGDIALVHAVAGGVGQMLTQIIGLLGGTVIGLTSSAQKAKIAKEAGANEVFLYDEDWQHLLDQYTNGNGVDVVYDSVGSTLMDSFAVTKAKGTVVFYGMSGGDPALIDPRMLMDTSKTLTGGDLWNVLTSSEERITRSAELFSWVEAGQLVLKEPVKFLLKDGKLAHELIESRKSTGKILLIPS